MFNVIDKRRFLGPVEADRQIDGYIPRMNAVRLNLVDSLKKSEHQKTSFLSIEVRNQNNIKVDALNMH